MSKQELLQIHDLVVQSRAGRINDFNFSAERTGLYLFHARDLRRITALLRAIRGLEPPLEGTVAYQGEAIGLVLTADELPPWSTPRRELDLFGHLRGLSRYDLLEAVSQWDLEGTLQVPLRHLDPFERTGLLLVMETAAAPELLLCEEPLAGLNPEQTRKRLAHLQDYARDHLVIAGTVNPDGWPAGIRRVDLDHQPAAAPAVRWEPSVPAEAAPESAPPVLTVGQPPPGSVKTTPDQPIPETVILPLPVDAATEYQLRRVAEIRFFEAAPVGGYAVDILPEDRPRLRELLQRRGLVLPDDWEG